jgi:uncharacterized membrane protein
MIKPALLMIARVVFACELALLLFYVFFSKQPFVLTDEILFLGASFVIFAGLWWKRIYSNPAFFGLLTPFIFFTMFIASWLRHGSYTSIYGVIAALATIVALAKMWLKSGASSEEE